MPACLTRQGWRSFLPEAPLRAAVLIAFASLSLIALAGFVSRGGSSEDVQQTTTIEVGDFWFCDANEGGPCAQDETNAVEVNLGGKVIWEWGPGGAGTASNHTTTECGTDDVCGFFISGPNALWDSSPATTSGSFGPVTFDSEGTFSYHCIIHPFLMRGTIVVLAAEPGPAPTPSPEGSPETSPQPSPASPASTTPTPDTPTLPGGGGAPPAQAGTSIPWWLLIAGGGFLMVSASLLALRLRR